MDDLQEDSLTTSQTGAGVHYLRLFFHKYACMCFDGSEMLFMTTAVRLRYKNCNVLPMDVRLRRLAGTETSTSITSSGACVGTCTRWQQHGLAGRLHTLPSTLTFRR